MVVRHIDWVKVSRSTKARQPIGTDRRLSKKIRLVRPYTVLRSFWEMVVRRICRPDRRFWTKPHKLIPPWA